MYYVAQGILTEYPGCGYNHSQRSSLCLGKAGWWGHTKVKKNKSDEKNNPTTVT